jgi:hypothetical protein
MPVSKKRKKDGRPVHRKAPPELPEAKASEHEGAEAGPVPAAGRQLAGRPTNPFVAQQQGRRGAQRGR